jgi:aconitate hydratase
MGQGVVGQILQSHLREGTLAPPGEAGIHIDQTLTQDATGTMTYLQFESMGIPQVATDLSVSYVDHNTSQMGFENADDHAYLQSVAAKYGIVYSRAGNGICHQVHLERFGKPGTTLLGSDSHTPTGGGIGQLAIGAGGLDVAVAMSGGPFFMPAPKVTLVHLTGQLRGWASAKDLALHMLSILGTKGNVGTILEYGGPGVATLSVPERATITNMGAELGVTSSVFPSDDRTRRFLAAQGREADWTALEAEQDASYDRTIEIELGSIEPLAACPHSPGNIRPLNELQGLKVDQVCIGSCTNSSLKDLRTVAAILSGKTIHPGVSLGVAPGSRQVLRALAKDGSLSTMIDAGARILESACGFCIGSGFSPGSKAVSFRTSNRNFEGRSGTPDAQVYLVSPEVAALTALHGSAPDLSDPGLATFGPKRRAISEPEHYDLDDSMFIIPGPDRSIPIVRGPNIGEPPRTTPYPPTLVGRVAIKAGDKITTDHIMPAGARLKYRSNIPAYSAFVFESLDPDFAVRCTKLRDAGQHAIVVAGESYGQGSSREHAAICPMYLGVKAVLTKSFERIHAANLVNFGIAPLVFADPGDYDAIQLDDAVEAAGLRKALQTGTNPLLIIGGRTVECRLELSARQRDILLAGGLLNLGKP